MRRLSPVISRVLAREARKFVARPTWTGAMDMMIRPGVEDFILSHAFDMEEDDLLHGALLAGRAVNGAVHDALSVGDSDTLDALESADALTPVLHAALIEEVAQIRARGDAHVEDQLAQLERERRQLDSGPAQISRTLLVVGAQRDYFPRAHEQHRLAIGSTLVVCDHCTKGLWGVERQRQLLEDRGCHVQAVVSFGEAGSPGVEQEQLYTFEASFDGLTLTGEQEDELSLCLADVNGRTDGDAFWEQATPVSYMTI